MTIQIGDKLKAARIAQLLTQFEVAGKAGVSPQTVANAEKGKPVRALSARRMLVAVNILEAA